MQACQIKSLIKGNNDKKEFLPKGFYLLSLTALNLIYVAFKRHLAATFIASYSAFLITAWQMINYASGNSTKMI